MKSWKAEINDDVEKFAERAKSDSHCKTAATGGNLGFVVRKNLCQQFDDVLFAEEPGRVYGPITTPAGLHLIFLHSCREPRSRGEVPPPFPVPSRAAHRLPAAPQLLPCPLGAGAARPAL